MLSAGGQGLNPTTLPDSERNYKVARIQPHNSLITRAFVQLGRVASIVQRKGALDGGK